MAKVAEVEIQKDTGAYDGAVKIVRTGDEMVLSDTNQPAGVTLAELAAKLTQEEVEDFIAGLLIAGTDIALVYDDVANTLTISSSAAAPSATLADTATNSANTADQTFELDAATEIRFEDSAGAGLLVLDEATGNLALGAPVDVGERFRAAFAQGINFINFETYSSALASDHTLLMLSRSRSGTIDTQTETVSGDILGELRFQGVNTGPAAIKALKFTAKQTGAAGSYPPAAGIFESYSSTGINSNQLYLDPNGSVGVGTVPSASYRLDINGSIHRSSATTSSDARFKQDVTDLTDVLDKIDRLRPVTFRWNDRYASTGRLGPQPEEAPPVQSTAPAEDLDPAPAGVKRHMTLETVQVGFIAQEFEQEFPELVTVWDEPKHGVSDYRGIEYERTVAVLAQGIKELHQKVKDLEARVTALEGGGA